MRRGGRGFDVIPEVMTWLTRILAVLPQLVGLWQATSANDPRGELEASLALVRAIKDRQALESIGAH